MGAYPPGSVVGSAPAWAAPSRPGQRGGVPIESTFASRTEFPSGFPRGDGDRLLRCLEGEGE